jgi:predicted membrane channel-forming protein YqfA (hemolysin III family)
MFALLILGALLFASRFPERTKPGSFDTIGNSHHFMHVLTVAGIYTFYEALIFAHENSTRLHHCL